MTREEFAAMFGLDGEVAAAAYGMFRDELDERQKTRAARCADLADGLRRLALTEDVVFDAVRALSMELRR